jgi:hypothetical protein
MFSGRFFLTLTVAALACTAFSQTPPQQPATGPGGRDYLHGAITQNGPYYAAGHEGDDAFRYWTFEPASPSPASAPVVLFLHAWLTYNPAEYQYWIAHMVLKGYTVVDAQYDKTGLDSFNWANNAATAFIDSLAKLETTGHVHPSRDASKAYQTAIVGHSAGGYLGPVIAAKATRFWWVGLPKPNVIAVFEPGSKGLIPGEDFTRIVPSTRILMVGGDEDTIVCLNQINQIWGAIGQISGANKTFLFFRSDRHGTPQQIANHFYPNNTGRQDTAAVDARDFNITYRLSVAALDCTYKGTSCDVSFGGGSQAQVDLGVWSDGFPVTPLLFSTDPSTIRPSCAAK